MNIEYKFFIFINGENIVKKIRAQLLIKNFKSDLKTTFSKIEPNFQLYRSANSLVKIQHNITNRELVSLIGRGAFCGLVLKYIGPLE